MFNVFALKKDGKFIGVADLLKRLGDNYYSSLKMINEEDGFVSDADGFINRFLEMHKDVKTMLEALSETFLADYGVSHVEDVEYPEDDIVALKEFVEDDDDDDPVMVTGKDFEKDEIEEEEMVVKKSEVVYEWVLNKNGSPVKAQRICKGTYLDPEKNVRFKADKVFASREKAREAARKIKSKKK